MTAHETDPHPPMGSLAWGRQRPGGVLNKREKVRLVASLAGVQARETVDVGRRRLGMLRPPELGLEHLMPAGDSTLVRDATAFATETQDQALLFHSWRTYLFGVALAEYESIELDKEVFFAAAILHDTGLTATHAPPLSQRCFASSGGERVQAHLRDRGHEAETADRVGEAVALHLNGWVSRRAHGPEAHFVSRGAVCDLFGFGHHRLADATVLNILCHYPRAGMIEGLQFETAQHLGGTRPAVMTALAGGKAPKDRFRRHSEQADSRGAEA